MSMDNILSMVETYARCSDGHSPLAAFTARETIRSALEDLQRNAYAEGRKDEREEQETFLRDLLWGEAQQCCGNYHAGYGGEYMGQVEMVPVCCGCPDVERNDDAQILAVLRARVPDPTICQTCHADPIPGHTFCPDCKDEWPA